MLSIHALGNAAAASGYYNHLTDPAMAAAEDYYSADRPGVWSGAGAEALNLAETEVLIDEFTALAGGYHADTGAALVQRPGEKHRAGWDATFSAPKSVSSVWARSTDDGRAAIERAHQRAVAAALNYLQDRAGYSRAGHGDRFNDNDADRRVEAGLIVAQYQHGTSRNQDPQLHTHCVVFNAAVRKDGSTGALDARPMYQHKMAAGAAYRAALSAELLRLGYKSEPDPGNAGNFRLVGVPDALVAADSTRRAEIEARLKAAGVADTAKNAERATLETRSAKQHVSQSELLTNWAKTAAEVAPGWTPDQTKDAPAPECKPLPTVQELTTKLTEHSSVFRLRDVERAVFEAAPLAHVGLAEARLHVDALMLDRAAFVQLHDLKTGERIDAYSTPEMIRMERETVAAGERMAAAKAHAVPHDAVAAVLGNHPSLTAEQIAMVRHVTEGADLALVQGGAGTGKSFALDPAREAWEAAGYRVRGMALSGKAAEGLEKGADIQSTTIARTLMDSAPWTDEQGREHEARDLFAPNQILVIDEAGMVDSRQLHEIIDRASEAGAKVVMVGDSRQLQPVEAGAPFRDLQERIGAATLETIYRQQTPEDRQAVQAFAEGRAADAIVNLDERGRVHVSDTARDAKQEVGRAVARDLIAGRDSLGLAARRADVHEINEAARGVMREAGKLGADHEVKTANGARLFAEGDRVVTLKNDKGLEVKNGNFGTVESIARVHEADPVTLTVKLDNGRTVEIDTTQYQHLDHGYAATAHKSQGATVDAAHVYASGDAGMESREWSYVAGSRARDETHIYSDKVTRDELAEQWSSAHQHQSTNDYTAELGEPDEIAAAFSAAADDDDREPQDGIETPDQPRDQDSDRGTIKNTDRGEEATLIENHERAAARNGREVPPDSVADAAKGQDWPDSVPEAGADREADPLDGWRDSTDAALAAALAGPAGYGHAPVELATDAPQPPAGRQGGMAVDHHEELADTAAYPADGWLADEPTPWDRLNTLDDHTGTGARSVHLDEQKNGELGLAVEP
ncbi:MAG TPA: MobF family relaxase [Nevskiaceae bacterium]|nr:MobF family relaxase [Nevskiaceae bacterium]